MTLNSEWIATMWYAYIEGYGSTITRDKCVSFVEKVIYLGCITLKELYQTQI